MKVPTSPLSFKLLLLYLLFPLCCICFIKNVWKKRRGEINANEPATAIQRSKQSLPMGKWIFACYAQDVNRCGWKAYIHMYKEHRTYFHGIFPRIMKIRFNNRNQNETLWVWRRGRSVRRVIKNTLRAEWINVISSLLIPRYIYNGIYSSRHSAHNCPHSKHIYVFLKGSENTHKYKNRFKARRNERHFFLSHTNLLQKALQN